MIPAGSRADQREPDAWGPIVSIDKVIRRHPVLMPLSCVAVMAIVLIGESTYSRLGVGVMSVACLLAVFMYLRQGLALEEQRGRDKQELQRVVQIERQRLELEVANRTAQLVQLTHHIETAREQERARLARDLHDDMGALLMSAKLDAARLKARLTGGAPEALERLGHLVATLNSSIALGRDIIENLRPSSLGTLGLAVTLDILARDFAKRSGVQVHCTLADVRLEESAELVVYRVVQEAITNVGKYAKASHLWLTLSADAAEVELSVRDDGVGFDSGAATNSAYGLLGMRFRVEAEGGTLAVRSAPSQGALITVRLPQAKQTQHPVARTLQSAQVSLSVGSPPPE